MTWHAIRPLAVSWRRRHLLTKFFCSATWRAVSSDSGGQSANIVYSQEPAIQHPPCNYAEKILENSKRWSDRVALECSTTGATTTYGQLTDQVSRWGGYLAEQGLGRGDVVALVTPNVNEVTPVMLGTVRVGGVATGINPTYTADEMAFQLQDSGAKMVAVFGPLESVVRKALAQINKDVAIVGLGSHPTSELPQAMDIMKDEKIELADPIAIRGNEPMSLMYSSGTTSLPKGVLLSHNNCINNLNMLTHPTFMVPGLQTTEEFQHTFLMVMPLFHVAGLLAVNAVGLHLGVRVVNVARFDPGSFVQDINKYKVSVLHVVPALLHFMLAHPRASSLTSLQAVLCGAAPLSAAVISRLKNLLGKDLLFQQAYGMTELLFALVDPVCGTAGPAGSTGRLLPGVQAKVLPLTGGGEPLPSGKDGEICIKSPSNMLGYLNNRKATAATVDKEGWLHTGDVGHYNEDGFFTIVDRTKELIKVKGLQVSPSEVEDVIRQLPEVRDVSVMGIPHDRLGEAPRAYVVSKGSLTKKEVVEHVAARLAPHKQLAGGVVFLAQLPRNTTGKVIKNQLSELELQQD